MSTNATTDTICIDSIRKIMEIFGGKWTFLVMGELHEGPRRFNELNKKIGCSTRSLSITLKTLEQNKVVNRKVIPTTPVTVEYSLTEKGKDFENIFLEMKNWGTKWLSE